MAAAAPSAASNGAARLGCVEVLRDSGSKVWYCGRVVDIGGKQDTLTVAFEGNVWPKAAYPFSQVRKPPRISAEAADRFVPKVGDEVEVNVNATEHAPSSWVPGVVRKIKHDLYFVSKAAGDKSEVIVEQEMLRPPTKESRSFSGLQQDTYKLPAGLQAWAATPDGQGCFGHVEEQTKLAFLQVQRASLKLFGDEKAIDRAKKLLEVHCKHQARIQDFQDKREKGLRVLEQRRSKIEGTGYKHAIELRVDPAFVRRIIGRGGEAIRALQEKYDVNVRIFDSDDPQADRIVKIFGNAAESVERARADIEFVEEAVAVEPEMFSWVVGRGGKTIQGFKDTCGLIYARLDRDSRELLLCGPKAGVTEAVAMFESHIMYFEVFRQMEEEMGKLIGQLEEFGDYNARWEWNQFRDAEEDDSYKGAGKGARPQDKGGKGGKNAKGAERGEDRPEAKAGKAAAKGGKDKGKGKGGKDSKLDWNYFKAAEDNGSDDDEDERHQGKGAKGKDAKGKDAAKSGSKSEPPKGGKDAKGAGKGKKGKAAEESDEESEEDHGGKKGGKAGAKGKSGSRWQPVGQELSRMSRGKSGSRWQPVGQDDSDDDDEPAIGKNGKAKKGAGKAAEGKASEKGAGKDGKDAKGRGKGKKGSPEESEEDSDEDEAARGKAAKGGKAGGKAAAKSGGKASARWQPVSKDGADESGGSDEGDAAPRKGPGRGRGPKGASAAGQEASGGGGAGRKGGKKAARG